MKESVKFYIFAIVLMAAGSIFGMLLANALTLDQQQALFHDLSQYTNTMYTGTESQQAGFWSVFANQVKWLLLIWLLGIIVIGLPGVLVLLFVKGAMIGFTSGVIILQFGWHGVLLAMAAVLPQNAIMVPVFIMAAAAAIHYGVTIIRRKIHKSAVPGASVQTEFTARISFLLIFVTGAALLEVYLSPSIIAWAVSYLPNYV